MSRAKKSRSLTPHVSHPLQTLVYLWIPRDYRIAGVIRRLKPAIRFPSTLYSSSYRVLYVSSSRGGKSRSSKVHRGFPLSRRNMYHSP